MTRDTKYEDEQWGMKSGEYSVRRLVGTGTGAKKNRHS
jgi:hypothetical protein